MAFALMGVSFGQQATTVLKEDWDTTSINSVYNLTNTSGTAANVFATGGPNGNVLRITNLDVGNNNSVAWDFTPYAADRVSISFVFSMSDDAANEGAMGCCGEAADGFGFGLFGRNTYDDSGATNPASVTGINWEDPSFSPGFSDALVIGLDVFDFGGPFGNQIRVAGFGGSAGVLIDTPAPFALNDGVFHEVIATLESDGGGSALVSIELVQDVFGAAIYHFVGSGIAGDMDPNSFEGRLIAGGRTGSAFVETLIDCVEIENADIDNGAPFFGKDFVPNTIGPGSTSRLNFTITNDSSSGVTDLAFTDQLPAGLMIAAVPDVAIDCEGSVSAPPLGDTITLVDGRVPANGTCTISVNVTAGGVGSYTNASRGLTSSAGYSGVATADLTVSADLPGFSKSFQPPQIAFSGRSTLTFLVNNEANGTGRNQGSFTDQLPAGIRVADPPNIVSTCGGIVTANAGSSTISFAPDFATPTTVGANQTCTVSVDVVGTSVGLQENVSGEFTSSAQFGAPASSSGFATATLDVVSTPLILSKTFVDDPVPPGGTATLEFTVTNRSRDETATDIEFTDDLDAVVPGLVSTSGLVTNVCGPGSQISGSSVLTFKGGQLAAGDSCTFSVDVQVPGGASPGAYPNNTSPIVGNVGGSQIVAPAAADTLFVQAVPVFTKEFIDDPTIPDGSVTLRFSITNTSPGSDATAISFIDELPAELDGQVSLPANDFCGDGSSITFTPSNQFDPARLVMNGGSLKAQDTCVFEVVLHVSSSAATGLINNTTEPLTATIDGATVTAPPASDDFAIVAAPQLTKTIVGEPLQPGKQFRIEYSLSLPEEIPFNATLISFTDDLDSVIPGLKSVSPTQNNICGNGSSLAGSSVVSFAGGRLQPGQTCNFSVDVLVPGNAPLGSYTSTTSLVSANVGGVATSSSPAGDDFLLTNMRFTKRFVPGSAIPGDTVALEFTIENAGSVGATNISFTDNLNDVIPGLVSTSGTLNNICGAESQISGTSQLMFQNGSLPAGGSCTFSVNVQVPIGTADDGYTNSVANFFAIVGGAAIQLPTATATLNVRSTWIALSKQFLTDPANPGDVIGLEFTLTNLHPTEPMTGIDFTDPLPTGLSGVGGTQNNICGAGSSISDGGTLVFNNGSLPAGGSCTFAVTVQVSPAATEGELANTTSDVSGKIKGLPVGGDSASDTLTIELAPPPGEGFGLTSITQNGAGTATLQMILPDGQRYCIEWSDDLENWIPDPVLLIGGPDPITWVDPEPANGDTRRFYRLVEKLPPA